MNKRVRQYIGIVVALMAYYIIHEGAHYLYALAHGVFRQINIMTLGVQIDVCRDQMTDTQLGWFCLVGPLSTLLAAVALVLLSKRICACSSRIFRACAWYTSIVMLVLDPLYIGILYRFFGGGDMNGIRLLLPELGVQIVALMIFVVNLLVLFKFLLPRYSKSFAQ